MRNFHQTVATNWQRFLRYLLSGGVTFLIYIAVLISLIEGFDWKRGLAAGTALLVAGVANYLLVYGFVFRSNAPHTGSVPRYFLVLLGNISANTLVTWLASDVAGFPYPIVQAFYLTVSTMMIYYFLKNKVMLHTKSDAISKESGATKDGS